MEPPQAEVVVAVDVSASLLSLSPLELLRLMEELLEHPSVHHPPPPRVLSVHQWSWC
jgi:hypothetical protein